VTNLKVSSIRGKGKLCKCF